MSFHMYDTYKSPVHCHEGTIYWWVKTFLAPHSHFSSFHHFYRRETTLLHALANSTPQ